MREGKDEKQAREKLKEMGLSYSFNTYDSRVMKFYLEDKALAWVALKFPAYLTHKGALSMDLIWQLRHFVTKPLPPHGIEHYAVYRLRGFALWG